MQKSVDSVDVMSEEMNNLPDLPSNEVLCEMQEGVDSDDVMSEEMNNLADLASNEVLPAKSKDRYFKVYSEYDECKIIKKVKSNSEKVVLAYFFELSQKLKPSSLRANYSMLKATIKVKDNVDISKYHRLTAFLKAKSSGYKPIKAKVFTERENQRFISEAADNDWLDVKVVCIFGVSGALRSDELTKIKVADIEEHTNLFLVRVAETKTKVSRSFTINGEFFNIVKKYAALRSRNTKDDRFFINYREGKCTAQVIGINKFKKIPARIASFLQLPEIERYTGHSFRRTSATILANTGASMERIKRHGAWRSTKIAEGYVEDSLHYKKKTGNIITSTITSASSKTVVPEHAIVKSNTTYSSATVSQNFDDEESDITSMTMCTMSQGYVQYSNDEIEDALEVAMQVDTFPQYDNPKTNYVKIFMHFNSIQIINYTTGNSPCSNSNNRILYCLTDQTLCRTTDPMFVDNKSTADMKLDL